MMVCVMAGCDYLPSIKGIGLKKAIRFVEDGKDIYKIVEKLKV